MNPYPYLELSFQVVATIAAADLLAGFIHWAEDAYVREDTPLIGESIGRPNTIHHHLPRQMTRNSWWESSKEPVVGALAIIGGAWAVGLLSWQVWLFGLVGANGNEVHKWSHRTRKENGKLITLLQKLRIIQSPQHHAVHHTNPKDVRYCPITNLVNPVLDTLHFWSALEWVLAKTVGLRRRPDTSVPGNGPAPAWITEMRKAG